MAQYAIVLDDPTGKDHVRAYTRDYHVGGGHLVSLARNRFGQLCCGSRKPTIWKTRGSAVNKKVQLIDFNEQRYGKARVILVYPTDFEIEKLARNSALVMFDALVTIAKGAPGVYGIARDAIKATQIET